MAKRYRIKPAPGVVAFLEGGGRIPDGGIEVTFSTYYSRLMKAGDIVEVPAPSAPRKKAEAEK